MTRSRKPAKNPSSQVRCSGVNGALSGSSFLIGGRVSAMVSPVPNLLEQFRAGKVGPLAVTVLAGILRFWHLGQPKQFIFDETYYAKDAYGLLTYGHEQEFVDHADRMILNGNLDVFGSGAEFVVHPPLGKWLIAATTGIDPMLKWPNDIQVGERKLGGILAEVASPAPAIVVGLVPLPREPEVPALASLLVQGLVASEARLRSRQSFSAAMARTTP